MSNISRGIVCRHYFQVMMHSKVAGFHIQMIPSRWYTDEHKDNNVVTEPCCFMDQEIAKNHLNEILTPNPSTVPKTVTCVLRRAAQRKLKYGEMWGLARQAAQLAIEHNNHGEMVTWLRQFINQHKKTLTGSVRNRDQALSNDGQVDDDYANKENEPGPVENPSVSRRKGRPETKRYKSATEKKPRAKYTCSACGQSGHNSASCQNR